MELTRAMADEYRRDWTNLTVRPDRARQVREMVKILLRNQKRYETVAADPRFHGMPWAVVAVVDAMESSGGCDAHLHNGDNLKRRTYRHPKGRPAAPPKNGSAYEWEESALDALDFDGADEVPKWDLPHTLFWLEGFNGYGYRSRRVQRQVPGIKSPYLYAGSSLYNRGKFVADHVFDPNYVSKQIGAAVILKSLGFA